MGDDDDLECRASKAAAIEQSLDSSVTDRLVVNSNLEQPSRNELRRQVEARKRRRGEEES